MAASPLTADAALRSVARAVYRRAGQDWTDAELDKLLPTVKAHINFDPIHASEKDILGLLNALNLPDNSVPATPGPVSLTRTLPKQSYVVYQSGSQDLTEKSLTDLSAMLNAGQTTSREIVLQYLYKIQKLDHAGPALRSVTELNPDLLSIADQLDTRRSVARAKGETLPAMFGIPVLVKDNISTADSMRTTASSLSLIGSKPSEDASLIVQLRAQGAIILGKANMSEWANFNVGLPEVSPMGGVVINPFDPKLSASGSSSGSAVAAAMKFAAITVGTETNGSLIGPGTTHHVWALKPTPGLVSRSGVIPAVEAIDTPGPMGNSPTDLATLLNAMKGIDVNDPLNAAYTGDRTTDFTKKLNADLTNVKIGVRTTSAQIADFVKSLSASANATVITYTKAQESNAFKTAIAKLSDSDLAVFYTKTTKKTLPSDEAARNATLSAYRNDLGGKDGSGALSTFSLNQSSTNDYQMRKYIDRYLSTRVSNPQDYVSAAVRLMGNTFKPISGDPDDFAKSIDDVAKSDNLNRAELSKIYWVLTFFQDTGIITAAKKTVSQYVSDAGFSSEQEYDKRIEKWKEITTSILNGARKELSVDVTATDRLGTNFTFETSAYGSTPNLAVPVGAGSGPSQLVLSSDNFNDELLLRVGYALDKQLATPAFASLKSTQPSPPDTGFTNQPADRGPLLPLVLNDLDDHGRANKAHLLSTTMAPLVLHTTGKIAAPTFDGRVSGEGGLIKEADGTQTLVGVSDFTGDIQIWKGALAINATEALGNVRNAVTLENGAALAAIDNLTLDRSITLKNGGGLSAQAGTTLAANKIISGNGGLAKTGTGTLVLGADNAYTGGTHLQAGTLSLAKDSALGQDYGAITLSDRTTLAISASFDTRRQVSLSGGGAAIALAQSAELTIQNLVSGTGALALTGQGTLTLTGPNTYAGGTALDAGTLVLASTGAAGLGDIAFGIGAQTLRLTAGGTYGNRITSFGVGDSIDLESLTYTKAGPLAYDATTGILRIGQGADTTSLSIARGAGTHFTLTADSDGSTLLGLAQDAVPPPAPEATPPLVVTGGTATPLATTTDPEAAATAANRAINTLTGGIDAAAVERAVAVFVAGLPTGMGINVTRFVPTAGTGEIRLSGPTDGTSSVVALDASSLPTGTPIRVDNVGFLVVSGPASLVGGDGAQVAFGDDAAQSMVLGADDDTLHGGGGNDVVVSKGGADLLYGDAGNDTVSGGIEADTLFGGWDQDLVYGNQDADLIYGNQGNDTLFGGQGDDRGFGGQGNDQLSGNAGNDVLYGNAGADAIYGNQGSDLIYGNLGADILYGGQSADTLFGGMDGDVAYGNFSDDVIYGNRGADTLFGGQGADTLYGGRGDDVLVGGRGDDILVGGLGADLYRFDAQSGHDLILGFDAAAGDRIALSGQGYMLGSAANGNAILSLTGGGSVELVGIRANQAAPEIFATETSP